MRLGRPRLLSTRLGSGLELLDLSILRVEDLADRGTFPGEVVKFVKSVRFVFHPNSRPIVLPANFASKILKNDIYYNGN